LPDNRFPGSKTGFVYAVQPTLEKLAGKTLKTRVKNSDCSIAELEYSKGRRAAK
jgi:hypothetical protein